MRREIGSFIAAAAWLAAGSASAEPGLADEIYSPTLTAGQSELELRSGIFNGGASGGAWQTKLEASHSFASWWRPALVAEWEHEGDQTEFTAAAIENVFDFAATRAWPMHFGGYVEYEFNRQHGPDALELKLLAERVRGPFTLRLNLIGERPLEHGEDWEYGYAAEASYRLNDDLAFGLEGFGEAGLGSDFSLSDRAQYWGPFAYFEAGRLGGGEVELRLGYLAGFGEAEADSQFRLKLEYEFGADRD